MDEPLPGRRTIQQLRCRPLAGLLMGRSARADGALADAPYAAHRAGRQPRRPLARVAQDARYGALATPMERIPGSSARGDHSAWRGCRAVHVSAEPRRLSALSRAFRVWQGAVARDRDRALAG